MLISKKTIPLLFVFALVACAIPEPQKKELSKTITPEEANLKLESAEAPKALSEEYDSEIDLPLSKKFQFQVCLKSSLESVKVAENDPVILSDERDPKNSKNLLADSHACVQWEESVALDSRAASKEIQIDRQLLVKSKFKTPLTVSFLLNPWEDTAEVLDKAVVVSQENQPEAYELGFESLSAKITKKSDASFNVVLTGSPTINGKILKHGKVKGQFAVMFNKDGKTLSDRKVFNFQGSIKNGVLALDAQENSFVCSQGIAYIDIQMLAVTKRHYVRAFRELHTLKSCDQLEGTHALNEAVKANL